MTTSGPEPDEDDLVRTRRRVVVAGHQGDVATVTAALTDPRPQVRLAALGAAARLDRLDDERLQHAMVDEDPGVRRRAVELAGRRSAGPGVVDALLRALSDEPSVAEVAAFSLGELEVDRPDVVAALGAVAGGHDDPLCREAAVAALGAIGDGLDVILRALATDRATVRRRAVIALAPFEGPEVDAALERALQDRDWQVRQAAEDLSGD